MRHAKRIFSTLAKIRPRLRSHNIPSILHNRIHDLILRPRTIIHLLRRRSRARPFRTRRTLPTRRRGPTTCLPTPIPNSRRSRRLNGLERQMLPRLAAAIPLRVLALLAIMFGHDVRSDPFQGFLARALRGRLRVRVDPEER